MRTRAKNRPGFTLLELIVAMAMVAVIALSLAASLGTAFKARSTAEKSVETSRNAALVMEFLRSDLQCAMPPSRGSFALAFTGTDSQDDRGNLADDLIFYTTATSPTHPDGGNGEIKQIEITSYQPIDSTDHILVRRTLNNLSQQTQNPNDLDEEVLCRNVFGFNVQYFDGTNWLDNWDSTQYSNSLPPAVMVTLSLVAPDKNPDGSDRIVNYTRVFQLPCYGQSNDTAAGISGNAQGPSSLGGIQ